MRVFKQIAYTGLTLGLVVSTFWILGGTARNQNQIERREVSNEYEIIISEKEIFPHLSINKTSFYLQLTNPNEKFWAENVRYQLNIYNNADQRVRSIYGESSIPPAAVTNEGLIPGRAQIIIASTDINPVNAVRIGITIMDSAWKEASTYMDARLNIDGLQFDKDSQDVIVKGVVRNNALDQAREVMVGVIFRDSTRRAVGVSQIMIGDIASFATSDFEILWRNETDKIVSLHQSEVFVERR